MSNLTVSPRDAGQESPRRDSPQSESIKHALPSGSLPDPPLSNTGNPQISAASTARVTADLNPRRYACPDCGGQNCRASHSVSSRMLRLVFEDYQCNDCGVGFRKIQLRVWFAILFLGWSLAMLSVAVLS